MNAYRLVRRSGVTLIEMLIVVAILAILAAGTMSLIVAPMHEEVISGIESASESGVSSFFSKVVADAHSAQTLVPGARPMSLRLSGAAGGGGDVVYAVDARGRLRRGIVSPETSGTSELAGAALLDHVTTLSAERVAETGLWRISVAGGVERLGRNVGFERSVEVGVGPAFLAGGGLR